MGSHRPPQPGLASAFDPTALSRPDRMLWYYYLLVSLLTGPGLVIVILPLFFKYETLRYHFDDEGVSMSWGFLFRKEVYLTYRRIQDIHLTRNILQRWMGLATVSIQTASGNASPEMSIEGILQADLLRDFLYTKMRGAKGTNAEQAAAHGHSAVAPEAELTALLRDIRDALRQAASQGASKSPGAKGSPGASGVEGAATRRRGSNHDTGPSVHQPLDLPRRVGGAGPLVSRAGPAAFAPDRATGAEAETPHSFQPAEGFLRYLKFGFWVMLVIVGGGLVAGWIALVIAMPAVGLATAPLWLLAIAAPALVAYLAIHLRFDTTWYVMTSSSLRLRRGIWIIHETTITFENVQNVIVNQGPLQRLFGIADVLVETAGGGAPQGEHGGGVAVLFHRGLIEGLADAPRIRDQILSRLRASRTAGLGDETHIPAGGPALSAEQFGLLREVRDAARMLAGGPEPLGS